VNYRGADIFSFPFLFFFFLEKGALYFILRSVRLPVFVLFFFSSTAGELTQGLPPKPKALARVFRRLFCPPPTQFHSRVDALERVLFFPLS